MAGFWHTVFFGGSGEGVEQELVDSYSGYNCIVVNSDSHEEGSHITVESDRGWGHEQTEVMGNAHTSGRVSLWTRLTTPK